MEPVSKQLGREATTCDPSTRPSSTLHHPFNCNFWIQPCSTQHVHTTIFNPISFATHSLLVLCMRKRLFSSHVKWHSTCDPSSTLHLLFNCNTHSLLFLFQKLFFFLHPTMFNLFQSPFKSLNWQS